MAGLVSGIIPVYNSGAFIEETLDSVAGQTYKDIEIIVVDDGSTDGTKEIVSDYAGKAGIRLKLLANAKRKGAAGARNTAIDEASGDFIAFIDADDKGYGCGVFIHCI